MPHKKIIIGFVSLLLIILSCSPKKSKEIITGVRSIQSQGLNRTFVLRVPKNYKEEQPMPLVIVLHGSGGKGLNMEGNTKFSTLGESEGFISIFPDALPNKNNIKRWESKQRTINDKQYNDRVFIENIIDLAKQELNIDNKRIYLAGLSNGAFFTHKFGLLNSNTVAAIATFAGSITDEDKDLKPLRPLPIICVHGINDSIVVPFPKPNKRGDRFSIDEVVNFWINNNNTTQKPITLKDNEKLNIKKWSSNNHSNSDVVLVLGKTGTHYWFKESNEAKVDASKIIWDFFKTHSKK